jgi:hypothetical protein
MGKRWATQCKKLALEYAELSGSDAKSYRWLEVRKSTFYQSKKAYAVAGDAGWDMSLSYYHGWDDLPSYRQRVDVSGDSLIVQIQPRCHRRHVLGGDFSTAVGTWEIRGEAAYFMTDDPHGTDPDIDDPYFHYVIGIDHVQPVRFKSRIPEVLFADGGI